MDMHVQFPLWGRDKTVLAHAGLREPRDAESVAQAFQRGSSSSVQELGEVLKDELTAEQRLDLQYMLDAFPPINEATVGVGLHVYTELPVVQAWCCLYAS